MAKRKKSKIRMRTVGCPGEAHSNPNIDHCMLCLNSPAGWAQLEIPAAFPDLAAYDAAPDTLIDGAGSDTNNELWDLHSIVRIMWDEMSVESRVKVWERTKLMRERHAKRAAEGDDGE